jgi:hypothetical protein
MDFEQVARESGLMQPKHVKALLLSLKTGNFSWIVCGPSQTEERLQGDLVLRMPMALIDPTGMPRSKTLTAMVINNVCDLQPGRSEFVTLAPVEEFERFAAAMLSKDPERAKSYLETIRANLLDEFFYIPNCSQLPGGGIVRFDLLSSLSAAVYEKAIADRLRIASLTRDGFYFLLMKLTRFLARPESSDVSREGSA